MWYDVYKKRFLTLLHYFILPFIWNLQCTWISLTKYNFMAHTPLWDRYLLCSISQSCVYQSVKLIKPWTSTVVGMFIVLRPIAAKNRTCKQATKPQTNNYCCCLLFGFSHAWLAVPLQHNNIPAIFLVFMVLGVS